VESDCHLNLKNVISHTNFIKQEAYKLGFDQCGVAKANFLADEAPKLEAWLKNNYHGRMHYMANHFDKRLDPRLLVEGAQSVISLTYNYYPKKKQRQDTYKIAKYAYGEDYHFVIKDKLKILMQKIKNKVGELNGRVFVDSAPVLERVWAQKAGLGWTGKNSLLITPRKGSFYFLAQLIIDVPLVYDSPFKTDHCGTCTKCIDACPTKAILPNNTIDGSKCISYFTIELKDSILTEMKGRFADWQFGCDICQDVCPWNRFSTPHNEPLFEPDKDLLHYDKSDWGALTESTFKKIFYKSAVKRTKFKGLQRNIEFLKK
jgi:epoxyqueuosine reductase